MTAVLVVPMESAIGGIAMGVTRIRYLLDQWRLRSALLDALYESSSRKSSSKLEQEDPRGPAKNADAKKGDGPAKRNDSMK